MAALPRTIGFVAQAAGSAWESEKNGFIGGAFHLPTALIGYHLSERLTQLFPHQAILEGSDYNFDLAEFAHAGHCAAVAESLPYGQWITGWDDEAAQPTRRLQNGWLAVTWQGHDLHVLLMHWDDGVSGNRHYYIVAQNMAVAQDFFSAVCRWNVQPHDEVLVFHQGCWVKDDALFQAIKSAGFTNLVLREPLKGEILRDGRRFFAAQEAYERFGVPWKRGLLFAGPPGNGKTHTVKALANALGQPILYVRSFRRAGGPDEYSMQAVFERARAAAPCVLVLEDLDALVTRENRSFFLNEMDGFAVNGGILTLATTNYPERLDPAIVKRPSRFDRTYRFDLPAVEEREEDIRRWNEAAQPEMRLSADGVRAVATGTEGFSFAYLKELFLSAALAWMEGPSLGAMELAICGQVDLLRQQMEALGSHDDGDGDNPPG